MRSRQPEVLDHELVPAGRRRTTAAGRWAAAFLVVVTGALVCIAGLMLLFLFTWGDPRPLGPAQPPVVGMREVDGDLRFWLGTPCSGVTEVMLIFRSGVVESTEDPGPDHDVDYLILTAPEPGVTVEYLDLHDPDPAFMVERDLPEGFDWRRADDVDVHLRPGWNDRVDLDAVREGPPGDAPDASYFGEPGWLTPAEFAAADGTELGTLCGPAES